MGIAIPIGLVAAGAALWGYARWFEWHSLYHPRAERLRTPRDAGLDYEDIAFVAEDAVLLHGWWIPAPGATRTVLYCHGNGDNVGDLVDDAAVLHGRGWNVFLWDYRGYGRSRGRASEKGTYRDACAAYEVVRVRHDGVENPPVAVIGRSLGGAVAVRLAQLKPVRALVLESTFTSVPDLSRVFYPRLPTRWIKYRYPSIDRIGDVRAPLLVAHSPDDEVIPFAQGRALFEAARGPKRFVQLAGPHEDVGWLRTPAYLDAIADLIEGPPLK